MDNFFSVAMTPGEVNTISNVGLAHIGDGVYELLCRTYLCVRGDKTVRTLHKDTVAMVTASAQARYTERLIPLLTEEEQDYFRRGRNAHTHVHPRSATAKEYATATGLETLFGALYLLGRRERLNELFTQMLRED